MLTLPQLLLATVSPHHNVSDGSLWPSNTSEGSFSTQSFLGFVHYALTAEYRCICCFSCFGSDGRDVAVARGDILVPAVKAQSACLTA